jgi:hypothetical protein
MLSSLLFVATIAATAGAEDLLPTRWEPFVSVTPAYIPAADIDGGGDYESRIVAVRAGARGPVGGRSSVDVTFAYSYSDNRFTTPTAFGPSPPWGDLERIGLSVSWLHATPTWWLLSVSPSVDYFRETDATLEDALTYGGVVSVAKVLGQDRALGLGAGMFRQLEGVQAFVFPLVNWALTDRLRITNPLPAGPTGPAGLELSYRIGDGWVLGVGGAYREVSFRLREDGPYPSGVGEENGLIGFLHAGTSAGERWAVDLYVGAVFNGELEVQNRDGHALISRDLGTAPIVGATFKLGF